MLKSIGGEITAQELNDNFSYLDSEMLKRGELHYVSVLDYGAVGDGVVDDTTAIQTCINDNDHIIIPYGTYLISADINIPSSKVVVGAGIGFTTLKANGAINMVKLADLTNAISKTYVGNFTLDGNGVAETGLYLRYITNGTKLENIVIGGCNYGVNMSKAWYSQLSNVRVRNGARTDGFYVHETDGQVNSVSFINCQAHTCAGVGFNLDLKWGNVFISCQSENNDKEGFKIQKAGGLTFIDCYAENNGKTMAEPISLNIGTSGTVHGMNIVGGLYRGEINGITIKADQVRNVNILGPSFEIADANNRPKYHVQATANAQGVNFFGNVVSAAGTSNFDGSVTQYSSGTGPIIAPHGMYTKKHLQLDAMTASSAPNNSMFVDSADGKLKFKNSSGTVNALY